MGAFNVDCELQELTANRPAVRIANVMVDTGSEYTWLPEQELAAAGVRVTKKDMAFVMANGVTITRDVGYAYLRSSGFETVDEVVFARPDELRLLGARTLEGFAALVDSRRKRLVASGPLPVASGASSAMIRRNDSTTSSGRPTSTALTASGRPVPRMVQLRTIPGRQSASACHG